MPRKAVVTKARSMKKNKGIQRGAPKLDMKEQKAIKGFHDVHLLTAGMLKKRYGLSQNAVDQLYKSKMIEKVNFMGKNGKKTQAYQLSRKGEKYAHQQMGYVRFYKSNSPEHDLKLARQYFKLTDKERASWIIEKDISKEHERNFVKMERQYSKIERDRSRTQEERDYAREMLDALHHYSSVDGVYTREDGVVVSLEVVGDYSPAQIEAKINFCNLAGIQWNYVK